MRKPFGGGHVLFSLVTSSIILCVFIGLYADRNKQPTASACDAAKSASLSFIRVLSRKRSRPSIPSQQERLGLT